VATTRSFWLYAIFFINSTYELSGFIENTPTPRSNRILNTYPRPTHNRLYLIIVDLGNECGLYDFPNAVPYLLVLNRVGIYCESETRSGRFRISSIHSVNRRTSGDARELSILFVLVASFPSLSSNSFTFTSIRS
jgi:hypothetical protein